MNVKPASVVLLLAMITFSFGDSTASQNLTSDEIKSYQIPSNCTSEKNEYDVVLLKCEDVEIEIVDMPPFYYTDENKYEIYRVIVSCFSSTANPYKYLSQLNSKRTLLSLDSCPLPPRGQSFADGLTNLESFGFKNNLMEDVGVLEPEHFIGMDKLVMLYLNAKVAEITPDLFTNLVNLKSISLVGANRIDPNAFLKAVHLESIDLGFRSKGNVNDFGSNVWKNFPELKALTIKEVEIEILSKQFVNGAANLEFLEFYGCKIHQVDSNALESLTKLKAFSLSFNVINDLPENLLSRNENLTKFVFTFNRNITELPRGFLGNLPNLKSVSINDNYNLLTIPRDLIWGSTNLEDIRLRMNPLTSLPKDLLKNQTKLKSIDVTPPYPLHVLPINYFDGISDFTNPDPSVDLH